MNGLQVNGLGVSVAGKHLVRAASFAALAGEITCMVGPNGAGKSTLVKALAGIHPHTGGASLLGESMDTWSPRQRAASIGYVPQRTNVVLPFTALEIVAHGLYSETGDGWAHASRQHERAAEALATVGMAGFAERIFLTLSGGEQQLVLLARALISQPRLVLLDEPASALDVRHRIELDARLRMLAEQGLTVLVVLHDLAQVLEIADAVIVLADGCVVSHGVPSEALSLEVCAKVFGIEMISGGGPGFRRLDV